MDKSLKIVLIAFAIYTVLSLQILLEKGFWLIPYNYNPITIFLVSFFVTVNSIKLPSFKINLIYLIGVSFYCFLSERTLYLFNYLLKHYFNNNVFEQISTNPYLRFLAVFGFAFTIFLILIFYIKKQPKHIVVLILYSISFILGLMNFKWYAIISFSIFVLLFYILISFKSKIQIKSIFQPVSYQLLFFVIVENLYFYFS